jgi:PadR family transcriptional regulator, regulatory protein PadR
VTPFSRRRPSAQTSDVLLALAADARRWRHGYSLAQELGLKSGTLYPILMRLADQGLLESAWELDPPLGRPARHVYRVTAEGMRAAAALVHEIDAGRAPQLRPAGGA